MNSIYKLVLAAGLAIGATTGATAATLTFLQSGTFTSDFGDGFANSDIALGDAFTLASVYDTTDTPTSTFTNSAYYTPTKITLSVNGEIRTFENQVRLVVSDNLECCTVPATVFDAFQADIPAGGFSFAGANWTRGSAVAYFAPTQFNSTNLPGTLPASVPISVRGFDSIFQLQGNTLTGAPIAVTGLVDQASIVAGDASPVVSPVPLPAGGLLLLSGIAGFVSVKRRKRCTST